MKIYAINFEFDNCQDYDMRNEGEEVLNYYASLDLAKTALDELDPEELLRQKAGWMNTYELKNYHIEEDDRGGIESRFYVGNEHPSDGEYTYEEGWFRYYISEIDVLEDMQPSTAKKLNLKVDEEFKENLVSKEDKSWDEFPGIRYHYEFENHYGASVIKHHTSYGYDDNLWELALLKRGELVYEEIVGGDVLGYLTDAQVNRLLHLIKDGKVHEYPKNLYEEA